MSKKESEKIKQEVMKYLSTVIDPELGIDIVSMGLIYSVIPSMIQTEHGSTWGVHILMTLTTPGCPLIGVIQEMIYQAIGNIPEIDPDRVTIELSFDPPWHPEMMTEEARAELDL